MSVIPAGIVFVNNDLVIGAIDWIVKQMHISEYMDGYTFDQRVAADPEYVNKIKQLNLRIMVIRNFSDYTNRDLADLAIFVKNGLASVLKNNYGIPQQTVEIKNISWSSFNIF